MEVEVGVLTFNDFGACCFPETRPPDGGLDKSLGLLWEDDASKVDAFAVTEAFVGACKSPPF